MKISDVTGKLRALMPDKANRIKIEVRQLGLATGQIVPVRVIRRKHINVTYIP